ncbi:MAG: repair protein RecN [Rickettsiaceae bacterium]|jgi:DNA repair protein RecN (Recombination protein N)|nr:repair protein RecN [Rickettsiaceae bacterium]
MLLRLSVKNFILIDKLDIEFNEGLCAITGETGAGKSILIDSLMFCLGGRFNASVIKQGTDSATVAAEFSMSQEVKDLLLANDIDIEDTVLIKRHHNLKNQKKFYINDIPVTGRLISDIAAVLLDYHGQNQHNYLENPETHIKILDSFAGAEDLGRIVAEKYRIWRDYNTELELITSKRAQIEGEKSYLEFVVSELEKAAIEEDEEEKLSILRIELQQKAKSEQLIADTLSLMEAQSFENKVMQMQKTLAKFPDNTKFNQVLELLDQALINYTEAKELLSSEAHHNDSGYNNLEEIEERLFFVKALSRKYNTQASQLPKLLEESSARLKDLNNRLENTHLLRDKLEKARSEYLALAKDLSEKRHEAAVNLEARINEELKFLKMEKATFKVEVGTLGIEEIRQTGIDNVRFLASTNPGTPLAPIDKIASGGELSRLMLALKVVAYLAWHDKDKDMSCSSTVSPPDETLPLSLKSMIFDEIDTGLGGMVASLLGDRLKLLSKFAQVIVITHQPQVAGLADQHIVVQKHQSENRTEVSIKTLGKEERLEELARMLAGKQITKAAKEAALELMGG